MRFVVDECTGPAIAQWLKAQGHDVVSIFDECVESVISPFWNLPSTMIEY